MPGIHLIVTYSANKTGMEINLSTHTYYQNQKSSQRMIGDCEGSRLHTVDPINFQVWNVKSLRIEVTPVTSSQKKKTYAALPFSFFSDDDFQTTTQAIDHTTAREASFKIFFLSHPIQTNLGADEHRAHT
jgi:hypothetical protein